LSEFKIELTFLLLASEEGASVGSGIKLATIAKKITPAKNYDMDEKMTTCNSSAYHVFENISH